MTRVSVPYHRSTGKPEGPRWSAYRKQLIATWTRAGRPCFYCRHAFQSPGLIEVCHLISPIVRPDLAWEPGNLVPGHGRNAGKKGNRRCPECQLNCNFIAAMAPDAPKDPDTGEDLPFTPEFLARQVELLRHSGRYSSGKSPKVSQNPGEVNSTSKTPSNPANRADVGREW